MNEMQVLIQNKRTKLFLQGNGNWTREENWARDFLHPLSAWAFAVRHFSGDEVEMVYKKKGCSQVEASIPLN
jgi:hypothetical protein